MDNIAFRLDYEPGIRIGDFQDKPKVQKYHTVAEFKDLFGTFFRSVKVDDFSNNINAACAAARPVDPARLCAAIEFEFNLPYPDGTRMDLVQCAMDSFSQRLQINLPTVRMPATSRLRAIHGPVRCMPGSLFRASG